MKEENIKNLNFAVIDASVVGSFLLPDEQGDYAISVFDKNTSGKLKLISNTLLPYEVANLLFACTKSKRIDKQLAMKLFKKFMKFKITLLPVDFSKALSLSVDFHISVYDASYIYLAENEKAPLLTLDKELIKLLSKN